MDPSELLPSLLPAKRQRRSAETLQNPPHDPALHHGGAMLGGHGGAVAETPRARIRALLSLPEDGHHWHKYGEKQLMYPRRTRTYFRCWLHRERSCPARKSVDFSPTDPGQAPALVSYSGEHTHEPCHPAHHYVNRFRRHSQGHMITVPSEAPEKADVSSRYTRQARSVPAIVLASAELSSLSAFARTTTGSALPPPPSSTRWSAHSASPASAANAFQTPPSLRELPSPSSFSASATDLTAFQSSRPVPSSLPSPLPMSPATQVLSETPQSSPTSESLLSLPPFSGSQQDLTASVPSRPARCFSEEDTELIKMLLAGITGGMEPARGGSDAPIGPDSTSWAALNCTAMEGAVASAQTLQNPTLPEGLHLKQGPLTSVRQPAHNRRRQEVSRYSSAPPQPTVQAADLLMMIETLLGASTSRLVSPESSRGQNTSHRQNK